MINRKTMSIFIFSPIIILSFYSFGTFSFFNLFGASYIAKIIVVIYCPLGIISIFYSDLYKKQSTVFVLTLIFFIYYGFVVSLSKNSFSLGIIQAVVMCIIALFLLGVDFSAIKKISKSLVNITFILASLGFYVFFIYAFYPEQLNVNSYLIASSDTGNSIIYPSSYLDYFSFTSGDGYMFFGHLVTRVKGYSNEPSSTLVHYLAPVVFAMMYGGRKYRAMGLIIFLFSMIAISSLMGILCMLLSFLTYIVLSLKSNNIKLLLMILFVFSLLVLMLNANQIIDVMLKYGNQLNNELSYDLIARKQGSAFGRLLSYNNAIKLLINNPLGFSFGETVTGLWLQIALTGGVVLLFIYLVLSYKIISISAMIFNSLRSIYKKYGASLLVSLWITSFLITSYGWDRIPGVIILILFYRTLREEYKQMNINNVSTNI
jgi:hypothetical protein